MTKAKKTVEVEDQDTYNVCDACERAIAPGDGKTIVIGGTATATFCLRDFRIYVREVLFGRPRT